MRRRTSNINIMIQVDIFILVGEDGERELINRWNPDFSKTRRGRGEVASSIVIIASMWHLLLSATRAMAFDNYFFDMHYNIRYRRNLQRAMQFGSLCKHEKHRHRHQPQRIPIAHSDKPLYQHQPHQQPLSSTTTPQLIAAASTTFTFVSPVYQVYIEDTDAYGVMYNGNYIRSYERALSHVPRHNMDYSWMVSSVTNQKFRSSPMLGDEYIIRGVRLEKDDEEEVWQLEMATTSSKTIGDKGDTGEEDDDDGDGNKWIIQNSATVTILNTLNNVSSFSTKNEAGKAVSINLQHKQLDEDYGGTIFEQRSIAYSDEFETHHFYVQNQQHRQSFLSPYRTHSILPFRNALNFFERSRTNFLGGPDILRKMQLEEDILWVVTSVDDGKLVSMNDSGFLNNEEKGVEMGNATKEKTVDTYYSYATPSTDVVVRTEFIVKRRGMIVECRHELFKDENDSGNIGSSEDEIRARALSRSNGSLLAQATVTVMALKGSTRRPTSKLPQWIIDQITGTTLNESIVLKEEVE